LNKSTGLWGILPKISDLAGLQLFQIIRFGGNFLLAIVLVKIGADTNQVAEFESFIWITGLVTFAWVGGTVNTLLSNTNSGIETNKLLQTAQFLMLFQGAFFAILLILLAPFIETRNMLLASIYVLLNPVTFINEYGFLIRKQSGKLLAYGIATGLLTILVPSVLFIAFGSVSWSLYGLLAITAFKLLIHFLTTIRTKPDMQLLSGLFFISIPITATLFISSGAEYIDGWLVKHFFDERSFAIYRYGARELPLQLILANTLSAAMMIEVNRHGQEGIEILKRKSLRLMHFLFPFSLALMLCSTWLFVTVFDKDYAESVIIFDVLLLLLIPRLIFPQTILTAKGLNTYQVFAASGELVLNVALSAFLVTQIGLAGIAIGTVLAFLFDKLFQVMIVYRKLGIRFQEYAAVPQWLAYSGILVIVFCIKYFVL
jgi:O-antigen/teichoic acid export membrane protein